MSEYTIMKRAIQFIKRKWHFYVTSRAYKYPLQVESTGWHHLDALSKRIKLLGLDNMLNVSNTKMDEDNCLCWTDRSVPYLYFKSELDRSAAAFLI